MIGVANAVVLGCFNRLLALENCVVTLSSYSPASSVAGTIISKREGSLSTMSPGASLVTAFVAVFVNDTPQSAFSPAILRYEPFN